MPSDLRGVEVLNMVRRSVADVTGRRPVNRSSTLLDFGLGDREMQRQFKQVAYRELKVTYQQPERADRFLTQFTLQPTWTVEQTVLEICSMLDIGLAGDPIPPGDDEG